MLLLIVTYLLNIADYMFTAYWVSKYGIEIEANPFGRWMFENNVAWMFKVLLVGLLLVLLNYLVRNVLKRTYLLSAISLYYGVVVMYHIIILCSVYTL